MRATPAPLHRFWLRIVLLLLTIAASSSLAFAQTCTVGADLDAATRSAIENTAHHYLTLSAQGDVAGLKASAIPEVAANFSSIEQAVVDNKTYFAQGAPSATSTYLLDASQSKGTLQRADFYCGIYNSAQRVGFVIPNLPAGRYAVVVEQVSGDKGSIRLTMILQDIGGSWKLAGYYPRIASIGGHDGQWFLSKARDYKTANQLHNAWLYYLTAWNLLAPVNFMNTPQLDKLADEMQAARPADLPSDDSPVSLSAGGKTFRITGMEAVSAGSDLDLQVRYQSSDAANNTLAYQDNIAVIKAIVVKYPELRDAFAAVIARAVDSSGHNYGSLLSMKDVK